MKNNFNWDFLGIGASVACAVHCSVLPLFILLGIFGDLSWAHSPIIHVIFFVLAVFFVGFAFRNQLRNLQFDKSLLLAIAGISFLFVAFFFHNLSHVLSFIGGCIITFSHFMNIRTNGCAVPSSK